MSIFKCKMCGGTIEFNPGDTIGICDSCGTKQTLPRLDDDKKVNLYDRANHFRRNNEFDKAMAIYEQILLEDNTDAEAYWSLVLCRYGIEYVEDPTTHKRVPTVNRAQFTSIFADEDYKSALQYADGYQREIYEQEAKAIDEIQKGILEISSKEEPFDIFICYKETDNNGRRTQDSVLATDLYHQLTQEGFKVFFSRITLEDKLGTAYEPYIFAALNSAKVMVVLGTKSEYFNAVWVKNEWSRYLALVKQSNGKKMLIPAYRDMDPYDLPEEFSHLQAQDMSKLGFMQDLIRGIKKIVHADSEKTVVKEATGAKGGSDGVDPLLRRVFMFLEDGNFAGADEYCEKVLDQQPECAKAYLGKLMAELQVKKQERLDDCAAPFEENINYQKALKFGDEQLASELKGYISHIKERNEYNRLNEMYEDAKGKMDAANTEKEYQIAAETFKNAGDFKDAKSFCEQCLENAEVCRKDTLYEAAKANMEKNKIAAYEAAIENFQTIEEWKDAEEQIAICKRKIEELKEEGKKQAKKRKKVALIATPIVCVAIVFVVLLNTVILPKIKLDKAMGLIDKGKYEESYTLLEELGNSDAIASSKYDRAMKLIDEKEYEAAQKLLEGLDYKDSEEKLAEAKLTHQMELISKAKVESNVTFGAYEQDSNISNGKEDIEWIVLEKDDNKALLISKYALDCQPYNTERKDVTWETCSLRKWMNETFLKEAFDEKEQAMIQTTTVTADKNPGNSTTDKVFLLSISEVEKYFASDEQRKCVSTKYALQQGAYTADDYMVDGQATCWWWLRSSGNFREIAANVTDSGRVDAFGNFVYNDYSCVRPALWINLEP